MWRKIKEKVTGQEKINIEAAQKAYSETYSVKLENVPQSLLMVQNSIPEDSHLIDFWLDKVGTSTGFVRIEMETLLRSVCTYQNKRNNRAFGIGTGYGNDPINNVCYELNVWLAELAQSVIDKNTSKQIKTRISYLEKIIKNEKAFPQGTNHEQTIKGTLQFVVLELKNIRVKVKNQIANQCAFEKMNELLGLSKQCINHSFHAITGLFNQIKLDPNITMESFYSEKIIQKNHEMDKFKQTNLGKLLELLAKHIQTVGKDNPFVREKGGVCLPQALKINKKNEKSNYEFELMEDVKFLLAKNSGLATCIGNGDVEKQELVVAIYKLCSQLIFLAQQVKTLELACDLAGKGGDLLLYGDSNASTNNFLQLYDKFLQQFKLLWSKAFEVAESKSKLILINNEKKKDNDVKNWHDNFTSFQDSAFKRLKKSLKSAMNSIATIRENANKITVEERKAKIVKAVDNFNESISKAQNNYNHMMNEPIESISNVQSKPVIKQSEKEIIFSKEKQPTSELIIKKEPQSNTSIPPSSPSFILSFVPKELPKGKWQNINQQYDENEEVLENGNTLQMTGTNGKLGTKRNDVAILELTHQLIKYPSIRRILLGNNNITAKGLVAILQMLNTACVVVNKGVHRPRIQELDLTSNSLEKGECSAELVNDLFSLPYLEKLHLNNNKLGNKAGEHFVDLATSKTLKWLDMGYCDLGNSVISIAKYLKNNASLAELRIAGNAMGDTAATMLASVFSENKAPLKYLDIAKNGLTDISGEQLAEMIKAKNTLEIVHLNGNEGITDKTAFKLAEAIAKHPALRVLNLEGCSINFAGAAKLLEAMYNNKNIQAIQFGLDAFHPVSVLHKFISENRVKLQSDLNLQKTDRSLAVTDDFMKNFASLISKLNGLVTLDLASNSKITDASVEAILDIIKDSKSIKTINLTGTAISKEQMQKIESAAQNNGKTITKTETIEFNSQQKTQGKFSVWNYLPNIGGLWKKDDKGDDEDSSNKTSGNSSSSQLPSFGNNVGEEQK